MVGLTTNLEVVMVKWYFEMLGNSNLILSAHKCEGC